MDKVNLYDEVAIGTRSVDWPLLVGLLFIFMLMGLAVALTMRHVYRMETLYPGAKTYEHFCCPLIPVPYLTNYVYSDQTSTVLTCSHLKDMKLTYSDYIIYSNLVCSIRRLKHPLCNDMASWMQFCLLAGAEAFQRLRWERGQYGKTEQGNVHRALKVSDVITQSVDSVIDPYITFIFTTFAKVDTAEVDDALRKARNATGIGVGQT